MTCSIPRFYVYLKMDFVGARSSNKTATHATNDQKFPISFDCLSSACIFYALAALSGWLSKHRNDWKITNNGTSVDPNGVPTTNEIITRKKNANKKAKLIHLT